MHAVAFSPDDSTLASAGQDGVIHLWQTADWKVMRSLRVEVGRPWMMAFSPDGARLVITLVAGVSEVPTWDTATANGRSV